ncbi:MAG: hypothetical protein V1652_00235 [bacterium]
MKKNWKIVLYISIVCTIFAMAIHTLWAPLYDYYPPSFFVIYNLFKPFAALSLLVTFFLLGIVFVYIQKDLLGAKISKGIRYGITFGGLWFIAMPGTSLLFHSPLKHELVSGMCDALSILLLGFLLGKFVATDTHTTHHKKKSYLLPIVIIGFIYCVGRYAAYRLFGIELAYTDNLSSTLLWTGALGIWFGITYILLRQSVEKYMPIEKALMFGGSIVGIDWILFNLFAVLFIRISALLLITQAMVDIVLVILGIFVYERYLQKIHP